MTIQKEIEKYYSQLLDKDTKKKICELNYLKKIIN
jgi:hypothetical protein